MADDEGVSRADFDKLTGLVAKLGDSLEELAKRPNDQGAKDDAARRDLDVKDHAKALGLSMEDVQRIQDDKDYKRWLAFDERRQKELEEEEAEQEANGAGQSKGLGEQIRDGLGGIRNVRP